MTIKAFKFERTGIGKGRVFREKGVEPAASAFLQPDQNKPELYKREKHRIMGRDDFDDRLPF